MSERSEISASPVVLEFVYPAKDIQRAVVQVKNESDHRLALKIKTTNNTCFKVSFVYAVLDPRGEKKLTVGCAPIPENFNGIRDDKVVVCYTEIPDGEVDVREFWKTAPPLKAIRLPVMYRAQGEPSAEQAAEKPSEEKKPKEGTEGKVQEGAVPSADSEEKQVGGAATDSEDNANADQPEAKSKEEESDNKSDSSDSNAPGDEE
ncbi:sperm-specific protein [Trichinella spiralis]|uniref:sperm-specific protein n=1 Tax=Trichinella spiralis TaxID=6334 RepID=UPI0001EFC0AB|nr:sperm-specific protein [Trichinella spiralis]